MESLVPDENGRGGRIGRQRSVAIILAIALAIFSWPPSRVSGAQPGAQGATPPSGGTGESREPAPGKKASNFDFDAPPETRIRLAPFLTFGASLELEYELKKNFDLQDARDDDLSTLKPTLEVAFSFDPNRHFQAFLDLKLKRAFTLDEEPVRKKRRTELELKEAFIFLKDLVGGLSVQAGRQSFQDPREWLYDEELDAVRIHYRFSSLSLELSVSRRDLVDRDLLNADKEERINNYLLYGRYALARKTAIAAYGLVRDDRTAKRKSPIFYGLHSSGEVLDDLKYWIELAHVRGRDGSRKIRGIGLDLGATYQFDLPLKPSIALGYAFGTGDPNPNDDVDKSFRQTGFQENEAKFHGVTRFKYYGELFDPELSNLSILTGGIGSRPTRKSSVDAVYHYYLQHEASNSIRDAKIKAKPSGLSKKLGSEIDLIIGYEEIQNVDVKLILGYFIPGRAFPADADSAFFVNLEIEFEF